MAYDERDAILYALAVGAKATELDLVFEDRLRVLPTFASDAGTVGSRRSGLARRLRHDDGAARLAGVEGACTAAA